MKIYKNYTLSNKNERFYIQNRRFVCMKQKHEKFLKQKMRENKSYAEHFGEKTRKIFENFYSVCVFRVSCKKNVDICGFLHYILINIPPA